MGNLDYCLPQINNQPSQYKIHTKSGEVFYAHNVLSDYNFIERRHVIQNLSKHMASIKNPTPKQDAYCVLMWHLFTDYLTAYNFSWVRDPTKRDKTKHKKDLYLIRNSKGFLKIGITKQINVRLIDLKHEFEGDWELVYLSNQMGYKEKEIHRALASYIFPVRKRHTNAFSTECFEDCQEVITTFQNFTKS